MAALATATSRWSSRSSALRAALSGPWHLKQLSARRGRTSRLYWSLPSAGFSAASSGEGVGGREGERVSRIAAPTLVASKREACRDDRFTLMVMVVLFISLLFASSP